jgi:thymidine kinase
MKKTTLICLLFSILPIADTMAVSKAKLTKNSAQEKITKTSISSTPKVLKQAGKGSLTVIVGSMYARKTAALIERLDPFEFSGEKIAIFKPKTDVRKLHNLKAPCIESRSGPHKKCTLVSCWNDLATKVRRRNPRIVVLDEGQFLDGTPEEITKITYGWRKEGKEIFVAGLPRDSEGRPFGHMPTILSLATQIKVLPSICSFCGVHDVCENQRYINGEPAPRGAPAVCVQGADEKVEYFAACIKCHQVPEK